ncbi:MAG TPA: PfkB family carbohydrate kinase, partial [Phenylobacterium sp.]|nr:PfkB family carbohydrate kinase [Phenylobacterium sp.]
WAARCAGPVIAHWPSLYAGPADVLVASADDLDPETLAAPYRAGRAAVGERLAWVVVTRGGDGAAAYGPDGEIHVAAPPAVVQDATGAGDIFAAGLLDALVAGAEMEAALAHACAWGSAAVTLDASAPVDAPPGTFRPFAAG